jgi:hypothetical protein
MLSIITILGAGTAYPSGAPEFISCFRGVRVARSLVFCVVFCSSLFFPFHLVIVLSGLRFMDSDYLPLVSSNSFCRSLFVLLSFFIWPLCYLPFDLRITTTPMVSSNSSYVYKKGGSCCCGWLYSRPLLFNFIFYVRFVLDST